MLIRPVRKKNPEDWFLSGFGRHVLAQERRYCAHMQGGVFGFYALQLGHCFRAMTRRAAVRNHVIVGGDSGDIRADWTALPFADESVDFVLLAHALEAAHAPHAVLREAVRVLRPKGRLLVVGFNPWSLLGARLSALPWRRRWIPLMRLRDWLALLDMAVVEGRFAVFMPPHQGARWRRWLSWLEKAGRRWWPLGGGVYFLNAEKRVEGMRLVGKTNYRLPAWAAGAPVPA